MPTMPADDADDLTWLLFQQDGVISRRQALPLIGQAGLRHRVESGRWQRVQRGIFITHTGSPSLRQRWWAAVLGAASSGEAFLAGVSALQAVGLDRCGDGTIHVVVPAARRDSNAPPDVRVHRTRLLPEQHLHRLGRPPATAAARSLVDAAQWARSDNAARVIIAAGVQRGLATAERVSRVLARMPSVRRRLVIARAIADAGGGSHSLPELEFLALCRRAGLPEPSRQVVRFDADGRRCYLDAHFDEAGVHVEIDGGQHMDVEQWWRDMSRQNALWIDGACLLRFPAWAIRNDPARVIAQLTAALTRPRVKL
jgi:hypothetical protein